MSIRQLEKEHSNVRFEEVSPKAVEHVENFYTHKRPDLYSPSKIDDIDFHGDNTADHVKRHINRILHPPVQVPTGVQHEKKKGLGPGIRLGPFGEQKVPLARGTETVIFVRRGVSKAQGRQVGTGRFTGGEGPTTRTLAKFNTFIRSQEKKQKNA